MTTRIYQGKIVSAAYETPDKVNTTASAAEAILDTFRLLQEATNYHLVALAGMGLNVSAGVIAEFCKAVKEAWPRHPKNAPGARTLQQSIAETLCLPSTVSFEDAVAAIYDGCARPDVLHYVQRIVVERTAKGDGAIQQEGRALLPKLCDPGFKGNYDYSAKERAAAEGKLRLLQTLGKEGVSHEELAALADEMDLSWSGVKTQPNADQTASVCYSENETAAEVASAMEEFYQLLKSGEDKALEKYARENGVDLLESVKAEIAARPVINHAHLLAKNNKAAPGLKLTAIFFMYYPCQLSATLLKIKLGKEKTTKGDTSNDELKSLENDPILLARGKRGYIYRGYTALPEWQQTGGKLYSAEWDILAFKEALKTFHAFVLKTEERAAYVQELNKKIACYMDASVAKTTQLDADENPIPVLKDDPRYALLEELVKELAPDESEKYTISLRALNAYEEVRDKWLEAEKHGAGDKKTLIDIVRKEQGKGGRFGSAVLFEALCEEKYRPIWHDWEEGGEKNIHRSTNMLKDFSHLQELVEEATQYSEPVRITAAESEYSPRQLLFSDLKNFGPKSKGCAFVPRTKGEMLIRVAVRDAKGHWEGATVRVRYSAPRFERDELGLDSAHWTPPSKGEDTSLPWLQPMMKALGVDEKLLHLKKEPAVALQVKKLKRLGGGEEYAYYLNFPVTLDLAPLHEAIGKASLWDKQMLGGADEKLHLHWPETYTSASLPWWKNPHIREHGFSVLGVDLGVRYAAAWSLSNVQMSPQCIAKSGAVIDGRCIGSAEGESWYGFIRKQGLIRLDGEGNMGKYYENRNKNATPIAQTPPGVDVPTEDDKTLAEKVLARLHWGLDDKKKCSEESENEEPDNLRFKRKQNVLHLGNQVIKAFRRLISRCRAYHSMLLKLQDADKKAAGMEDARKYFTGREGSQELIPGIRAAIESGDVEASTALLTQALYELRIDLPEVATDVANLILPRKHGKWQWVQASMPGYICSGRIELHADETPRRHIYHRGGLSIARLSQLEELRHALQSLNRVLWAVPGVKPLFGAASRAIPVADPCPDLLVKIDNIREQRVNKIAHDIVAQALGVRLVQSSGAKNPDGRDIVHGVYEKIPGREPVDFVVLENLSRYLTSVDLAPDENSTLMRWCHRQLVAKVKQLLEEVFGIPVLCTHAAYTSKFDALSSAPGFRARELKESDLEYLVEKSKGDSKIIDIYRKIFANILPHEWPKGCKLIAPDDRNGGEFFVSFKDGKVRVTNADINASANIVWRGVAAPEALDLLHRVRLEKKKGILRPKLSNKREQALERRFQFTENRELEADSVGSAFCLTHAWPGLLPFASYGEATGKKYALANSKELWGSLKQLRWTFCNLYNYRLLSKMLSAEILSALKDYLEKNGWCVDGDDIPL